MKPVKVSVIIPVYNTELYIRQTILSILGQTLHDIEIIAVDDGSTDNSLSILSELAEQDHRIKVFAHRNQGVSVARNIGLGQASGEFIYFMDSDDLLKKYTLEICYQKCLDEQLDFVLFDAEAFCEEDSTLRCALRIGLPSVCRCGKLFQRAEKADGRPQRTKHIITPESTGFPSTKGQESRCFFHTIRRDSHSSVSTCTCARRSSLRASSGAFISRCPSAARRAASSSVKSSVLSR